MAGKKGLNLTAEQWLQLMSHTNDINNALSKLIDSKLLLFCFCSRL